MKKREKPAPKFPGLDALADAFIAKGAPRKQAAESTRDCAATVAATAQILDGVSHNEAFRDALNVCQELADLIMCDVLKIELSPEGYPTINVAEYLNYRCQARH